MSSRNLSLRVSGQKSGAVPAWTPLLLVPWDLLLLLFSPSNNNHSLLPHALSRSRLRPPATPTRLNQGSKVPEAGLSGRCRAGGAMGRPDPGVPAVPARTRAAGGGPLHVRRPRAPKIARLQGLQRLSHSLPRAPDPRDRRGPHCGRVRVRRELVSTALPSLTRPGPLAAP